MVFLAISAVLLAGADAPAAPGRVFYDADGNETSGQMGTWFTVRRL